MSADEEGQAVGRDDELGRALSVPPLDEMTRRRMVRVAMDRAAPNVRSGPAGTDRHRIPMIAAVAASLLVGVVVGGVVVTRPPAPGTPTAAGSGREVAPDRQAATEPAVAAPVPPQLLGDLGAAADIQELARAVDARLQEGRNSEANDATAALDPCAAVPASALVLVSATGTATLGGRAVVVRIGPAPGGENLVVVLDGADCSVVESTPLPLA